MLSGCGLIPQATQKADPNINMCYANYYFSISPIGRSYSTFVLAEISDLQSTMASFKQIATQGGYQIISEGYNGKEGILTIVQPATTSFPSIRYQISIYQDLGVISIAGREPSVQSNNNRDVDYRMCSLIAYATGKPIPVQPVYLRDQKEFNQQIAINNKIRNNALEQILQQALASGKSFVIIPALNLDSKYTPNQAINEPVAFWADQTSTTVWQNVDNPKDTLKVGFDESLNNIGLNGYLYSFVSGKSHYHLFIVNPGTYTIAGHSYEIKRTELPEVSDKQLNAPSRLGKVFFIETKNMDFYKTQEWSDAVYADRQVSQSYCTVTHVASGACVAWGSTTHNVKDQVQAAGWQTRTKSQLVSKLVIATNLTKNFASFKVNKGEVVMVDGFVAEYPNSNFNSNACQSLNQSTIQCTLEKYSLIRVPAHVKDIQQPTIDLPVLSKILSSAQYRKATIKAAPDALVSGWGQIYTLKNR